MSLYTTESLQIEWVTGIKYRIIEPLVWHIGHEDGPPYVVPSGFIFDVTIPWGLRWLFQPTYKKYLKAACLHDHMLVSGWDRMTAGSQFHQALKADNVTAWRRIIMWLAVSLWKYE